MKRFCAAVGAAGLAIFTTPAVAGLIPVVETFSQFMNDGGSNGSLTLPAASSQPGQLVGLDLNLTGSGTIRITGFGGVPEPDPPGVAEGRYDETFFDVVLIQTPGNLIQYEDSLPGISTTLTIDTRTEQLPKNVPATINWVTSGQPGAATQIDPTLPIVLDWFQSAMGEFNATPAFLSSSGKDPYFFSGTVTYQFAAPEPSTLALTGLGLAAVVGARRRQRRPAN